MFNRLENFLEQFPTNATCWSQATDEIRDLSRASREMLNEYDDIQVEAVDFTATRTPAEWNTLGRESIMSDYDMMRPRTQLLFYERFEDWFKA